MPISEFDAMAHHPHYRSQFGDTTFTKVFVGGLAWETPTEEMRKYFEQFGDILEAVIISDKYTGKSKGYGFVTFRDPESARRACADPKPMIDGRRANCNIASLGRPRPSHPPGRNILVQGDGGSTAQETPSYSRVPTVAAPPALIYPAAAAYGYPTYTPDYGYHQGTLYNPQIQQPQQYYQQMYAQSPSYYYGYTVQAPRPTFSTPHHLPPANSYLYHSTSMESYRSPLMRHPFPSPSADSQNQRRSSSETEAGVVVTSESANSQGQSS